MNLGDYIPEFIQALDRSRKFYTPNEIRKAKRLLPLKKLMALIGDEAFISERSILSPFGQSERPDFRLDRERHGWRFVHNGNSGDQIDYLKKRYGLDTGRAIALLCVLAGIR